MSQLFKLDQRDWGEASPTAMMLRAQSALESGDVVFCSGLTFAIEPAEQVLFAPAILSDSRKNTSYDVARDRLGGTKVAGAEAALLRALMRRFSDSSALLINRLFPVYQQDVVRGRASFRPAEIAGRVSSWRKDDTRLHVDAFPATPSGGKRILRVFANVNPAGRPRAWRIGDDFEAMARRFADRLRVPPPGAGALLSLIRVTKTPRSRYDSLMLQLHDRMKQDAAFQTESLQTAVEFPAGSTWMAFTDQVAHAAMSGQYQLEQTFLLPVAAMREPARSPLRVLERIKGQKLA